MKTVLCLTIAVLLTALYHNGVAAEKTCLDKGNEASVCAGLRL